jgi:uncharacterized protein YndB with AHSA1/START domain
MQPPIHLAPIKRRTIMFFSHKSKNKTDDQAVVISRLLDAKPEDVFNEWTHPECMKLWWGPKGFTTPVLDIDPHKGGIFHNCMRSPDGHDYCSTGIYKEIVPSQRIVCTDYFVDEKGNKVPATYYGMSSNWPTETLVTVTFTEDNGKTKLTLKHAVGNVPENDFRMCQQGWIETLDKLEGHIRTH